MIEQFCLTDKYCQSKSGQNWELCSLASYTGHQFLCGLNLLQGMQSTRHYRLSGFFYFWRDDFAVKLLLVGWLVVCQPLFNCFMLKSVKKIMVFNYVRYAGGKTVIVSGNMEVPVVQWLSSQDMDTATRVQILDLIDCISHSTNTLGKGMNPKYSPSSYG